MRHRRLFASSCLTCGARTEDGATYCTRHTADHLAPNEAARLIAQPYRAHYRSSVYQANRKIALERAHHRCQWPGCGALIGQVAHDWECDHIIPVRDGGTDEAANLQALCLRHARAKTRQDRLSRITPHG